MASLKGYQAAAERAARKLGVLDTVVVRWHGGVCRIAHKRVGAHIHTGDWKGLRRGTICIKRGLRGKAMDWMAHEVAHLVIKAGGNHHGKKAFLAAIAAVQPKSRTAVYARQIGAVPHQHRWRALYSIGSNKSQARRVRVAEKCKGCNQTRERLYIRA